MSSSRPQSRSQKSQSSNSMDVDSIPDEVINVSSDSDEELQDVSSDSEDEVLEVPPPSPPEDPVIAANRHKEEGNVKFKAEKYGEAIDLYTKAYELHPDPAFLTNRAAAYMAIKHFKPALEDCLTAANLQRASPQAKTLIRLARCQFALGKTDDASTTLKQALEIEPSNAQALTLNRQVTTLGGHIARWRKARDEGDFGMARIALESAENMIEGSVPIEWRCGKIEIEIRRKRWDAATSAASDALRMEPNSPEVLTLRALVLFLTNRIPSAIQHVQSALRYDPDHTRARLLLRRAREIEKLKEDGNAAFKSGRFSEAVNKYTVTLEAIGESLEEGGGGQLRAMVLNNRASAYLKIDQAKEAMLDCEACLKIYPGYYKAIRTRARTRAALEEYEESLNDFKAALEASSVEASEAERRSIEKEIKMAEVQLKRSKTKDYYKILKLQKDCTEIEIKKAYRRESLIHHPDKGGDEEKFKLVVEAHSVLSDPQRRARYDSGADEDGSMESGGPGGMGGMNPADLAEMFNMGGMGGMGGGGGFGGFPGGGFGGFPGGGFGGGGRGHSHGHGHGQYGF